MANVNMLKILSANCQGIRDKRKRYDVINYMKESYPNIICIQDTHLLKDEADEMRTLSDCECYLSGFSKIQGELQYSFLIILNVKLSTQKLMKMVTMFVWILNFNPSQLN